MNLEEMDGLFHELIRLETEEQKERNKYHLILGNYMIRRSKILQKIRELVEG
jgi:hypothetical protein